MRYLIILIIFVLSFGIASAQGQGSETFADWAGLVYKKINNSAKQVLGLVKQNTGDISRDAETKTGEILEEAQETITNKAEQAAEDIKRGVKEKVKSGVKKIFWGIIENFKTKVLNPLKIKIQEGSGFVREFAGQFKNYLIDWVKE